MASIARPLTLLMAFASTTLIPEGVALAQAPASAAFPPTSADPEPAPAPARPTPAAPAPVPATAAPAPLPPPPAPAPAPVPAYPPAPRDPPPPGYPPGASAPTGYAPPPPERPDEGFKVPDFSVRIDPFNWLLEGRLGLELEMQVYQFVSIELVPVFVTSHSPPTLNYNSYSSVLRQSSNGVGAISGAAIDAAFWFNGKKPFRNYALRVGLTNYAYTYDASDGGTPIDSVSHTEREFFVMLADASRWGAFMIGGGIGLGYELNRQNRCFTGPEANAPATSSCPKDQLLIKLDNSGNRGDLDGFLYPFDLMVRFSLGVAF